MLYFNLKNASNINIILIMSYLCIGGIYVSKISVIVPVFNVENYIAKCLDSLINQTLDNIEIIVVNDGSTDNLSLIHI